MKHRDYKWYHYVLFAIGGIALAAGFAILIGFVVMWLWNWLMVDIFSLPEINYWKAVGLAFLARLLFGHIGGGGGGKKKSKKHKRHDSGKGCGDWDHSDKWDECGDWKEEQGIFSMIKNEIRTEIRNEIRKEMNKEMEKEREKDSAEENPESPESEI